MLNQIFLPSPPALEASAFNQGKSFASPANSEEDSRESKFVIPLGSAFGIKLFTDGVIVASLSDVYTKDGLSCPAADAGICPGDYILKANGTELQNNRTLAKIMGTSQGKEVTLTVRRGEQVFDATVSPVYGDGSFKSGMWVRDSAAGIGTLTFYDPATQMFAGLGHGICDMDTSGVMQLRTGEPAEITLCGITKGEVKEPGRLRGYFSSDASMGTLLENNETGVYGRLNTTPTGEPVEVLSKNNVKSGPVQILATVDEAGPELYDGVIEKVGAASQPTKNLVIRITDPRLLEATGGIVQGMSGCPILQDGKLAGAVTHVFTEDPTTGYGIFAETMCAQAVRFSMS